ncbi:MAG: HAD-IC family P-type ATPase [Candidatus Paceibacterota bacterium]|jgi:Ca2+-transporting ATPase
MKNLVKEIQKLSFWSLSENEIIASLDTNTKVGLSSEEAEKRLKIFGQNIIEKRNITPAFFIFLNQFKSPLIIILCLAGIVTILIGHFNDSIFIFVAIVANTLLGFYQEYKAEKAISELKTYLIQRTRVVRDSKDVEIDALNLVPGDIVRLAQGDRVPADGRLVYINDFQIDEAILTGESLPVLKSTEPSNIEALLADQKSMVFAGTLVTQGVATVIICRTDSSTELGKIAELVSSSEKEDTPLQTAIKQFSIKAGIFLSILTLLVFITGIFLGYSKIEMFLMSVAIAVSAVPEGLPVAMTVILAVGVQRMAKRKGVVRKLIAAESLGSTSVILTDKTGTLTMAKMELSKILPFGGIDEKTLIEMALINSSVVIENKEDNPKDWRMIGRILEKSLVQSAALRGILADEVKNKTSCLNSLPFNAVNKYSVSIICEGDKHKLIFFGAPDAFVKYSTLSENEKIDTFNKINNLAEAGELVVCVATKVIEPKDDFDFVSDLDMAGLSFEGLLTLKDPIRPNIKKAITNVQKSGIKIVVLSGDHRGTAMSIAREVGLVVDNNNVLDATEMRSLTDEDLKNKLPSISVISRVSPQDKLRVVKIFQDLGETVAMTGDGVNDAPSIKQADVGIAMGSGTEVTRDVADLVLLDDNFETIAAAVEEGRQIMNNIRKVLVYLLSSITDELILIGGSLIMGLTFPMNALQILWVNFFTDSFPAIAFAFEKDGGGALIHRHRKKVKLFDPLMNNLIIFIGVSTSALLFFLYWFLLKSGYPENIVKTFIFASFGTYSLFLALSVRSLDKSIFSYSFFSNIYMLLGISFGLILMILAIYLPFFQNLFGTVSLPLSWLSLVLGIGIINIILIEFGKWVFYFRNHQLKSIQHVK